MSAARPKHEASRSLLSRFLPGYFSDAQAQRPTRVGLLNTGELVLIDPAGYTQVISVATVEAIRNTLRTQPPN